MEPEEIFSEIDDAAQTIQAHIDYLEEMGVEDSDVDIEDYGEGEYKLSLTLSVTSFERSTEQARQHCQKLAGSVRQDSAFDRFELTDTSVEPVEADDVWE